MLAAVKRTLHCIRLLIVTGALLSVPFVTHTQHAAAQPMREHMPADEMQHDCATFCATHTNNTPQQAVIHHEEIRTPDPAPPEYAPYYLQFQKNYTPRVLQSYVYGSYTIRPPDIVTLTGNYRS